MHNVEFSTRIEEGKVYLYVSNPTGPDGCYEIDERAYSTLHMVERQVRNMLDRLTLGVEVSQSGVVGFDRQIENQPDREC